MPSMIGIGEKPMNELKSEDVMEEAECCGYATGCTDCVLAKYDGSPCIVKKALALLSEKDALIKMLDEDRIGWADEAVKLKMQLNEKDAEIERLRSAPALCCCHECEHLERVNGRIVDARCKVTGIAFPKYATERALITPATFSCSEAKSKTEGGR